MKTILVPVDFSPISEAVVKQAGEQARASGARVVLFSAIRPVLPLSEYSPLLEGMAEVTASGERAASRHLSDLQKLLRPFGIASECVQLVGDPVDLIVDEARRVRADLIVMGSHGRSAIYDLLVGSTTHGVLKRARCPVIVIPVSRADDKRREPEASRALA
jgi:nucleotide-binding universal stress UspA family protein